MKPYLKERAYITIIVQNIKKKGSIYPLALDLARKLRELYVLKVKEIWWKDNVRLVPYDMMNAWVSNSVHHYCLQCRNETPETNKNILMVFTSDFITLPYTQDLTQAGLVYACKRCTLFGLPEEVSLITHLRQTIAEISVEVAIRRHLIQGGIPHQNLQIKHFTDPDRQILTIGGRRCKIISYLISRKWQIRKVRTGSKNLVNAPALVHADQMEMHHLNDDDIFIFTLINGLITNNQHTLLQAVEAGHPIYQIHILPPPWARVSGWLSLGTLTCQGDDEEKIQIEIGGMGSDRKYLLESLLLSPGSKSSLSEDFFGIHYLGTKGVPRGRINLTSSALKMTHTILPLDWHNLWIYGLEIILFGFITCREFNRYATSLPMGSRVFQFPQTSKRYLSMPISKLSPLADLFNQARSWNA